MLNDTSLPSVCMHPNADDNCAGKIVASHTIQENPFLRRISEDGHVSTFRLTPQALMSRGLSPVKVGTNTASTFPGFCRHHDCDAFTEIEIEDIKPTLRQSYLLSFRAACWEVRNKFQEALRIEQTSEIATQLEKDTILRHHGLILRTIARSIAELSVLLLPGAQLPHIDSTVLRACAIWLDASCPFAASSIISPSYDFRGKRVQDFGDMSKPVHPLLVTILPFPDRTLCCLCWHENADRLWSEWTRTLLSWRAGLAGDAIARLIFAEMGNSYFRTSWWNTLDAQAQLMATHLAVPATGRDPTSTDLIPNRRRLWESSIANVNWIAQ